MFEQIDGRTRIRMDKGSKVVKSHDHLYLEVQKRTKVFKRPWRLALLICSHPKEDYNWPVAE